MKKVPYVEVPILKKTNAPVYVPPHKQKNGKVPSVEKVSTEKVPEIEASTDESEDEGEDTSKALPNKTVEKKGSTESSAMPDSRPFDKNIPLNQDKIPQTNTSNKSTTSPKSPMTILSKNQHQNKPMIHPLLKDVPNTNEPLLLTRIEERMVDQVLRGEITMQVVEALAISPVVKRILKRKLNNRELNPKRRVQQPKGVKAFNIQEIESNSTEEPLRNAPTESYFDIEDLAPATFQILMNGAENLPRNAIVHRDIVDQFYADRPEDRDKKVIIVARRADDLRVTFPAIRGGKQLPECIMDNGSQIISMDTRIATGLHLHWDPDVRVHMQSANGTLNSTRGLARNVPFTFGDITVFMQVHIMDDVPYDVLIGRPFDVLCETEIKNAKNGDQFITITDPNTGRKVTIPTYPRGERPSIKPRPIEKLVDEGNGGNQEDSSESSEDSNKEESSENFQESSRNS